MPSRLADATENFLTFVSLTAAAACGLVARLTIMGGDKATPSERGGTRPEVIRMGGAGAEGAADEAFPAPSADAGAGPTGTGSDGNTLAETAVGVAATGEKIGIETEERFGGDTVREAPVPGGGAAHTDGRIGGETGRNTEPRRSKRMVQIGDPGAEGRLFAARATSRGEATPQGIGDSMAGALAAAALAPSAVAEAPAAAAVSSRLLVAGSFGEGTPAGRSCGGPVGAPPSAASPTGPEAGRMTRPGSVRRGDFIALGGCSGAGEAAANGMPMGGAAAVPFVPGGAAVGAEGATPAGNDRGGKRSAMEPAPGMPMVWRCTGGMSTAPHCPASEPSRNKPETCRCIKTATLRPGRAGVVACITPLSVRILGLTACGAARGAAGAGLGAKAAPGGAMCDLAGAGDKDEVGAADGPPTCTKAGPA